MNIAASGSQWKDRAVAGLLVASVSAAVAGLIAWGEQHADHNRYDLFIARVEPWLERQESNRVTLEHLARSQETLLLEQRVMANELKALRSDLDYLSGQLGAERRDGK